MSITIDRSECCRELAVAKSRAILAAVTDRLPVSNYFKNLTTRGEAQYSAASRRPPRRQLRRPPPAWPAASRFLARGQLPNLKGIALRRRLSRYRELIFFQSNCVRRAPRCRLRTRTTLAQRSSHFFCAAVIYSRDRASHAEMCTCFIMVRKKREKYYIIPSYISLK